IMYGSTDDSSQVDDSDVGCTSFNLLDKITYAGYIKTVSINFYTAPTPNTPPSLYLYIISATASSNMFTVNQQYIIPPQSVTNQTGIPQTFQIPMYQINVTANQFLAVGFGGGAGSPYRVFNRMEYYLRATDLSSLRNQSSQWLAAAGDGIAVSFIVTPSAIITTTTATRADIMYGSTDNSSQVNDNDVGCTSFNLLDKITYAGYIKTVSINFYTAPTPNTPPSLYLYIISATASSNMFTVNQQYIIPPQSVTNQTGIPQTFQIPMYQINVTANQFLAVGFGGGAGSPYRVFNRMEYQLLTANLSPYISRTFQWSAAAGNGIAVSFIVTPSDKITITATATTVTTTTAPTMATTTAPTTATTITTTTAPRMVTTPATTAPTMTTTTAPRMVTTPATTAPTMTTTTATAAGFVSMLYSRNTPILIKEGSARKVSSMRATMSTIGEPAHKRSLVCSRARIV
ncbi:unnamed protein product, partial [Didymodactylos carnosus]